MRTTSRSARVSSLALAASWAALLALPAPSEQASPTIVTLTFDDGTDGHALAGEILARRGLRGTFYVNSGRVGTAGFLGWSALRALAQSGHELAGHTIDHPDLTALGEGELDRQICGDRSALAARGHAAVSFAYPFGRSNAAARAVVESCGFASGRIVGGIACPNCILVESIPPANRFAVRTPNSIKRDTPLSAMQKLVTDAEAGGGGWIVLVIHKLCAGCDDNLAIEPRTLEELADWLKARGERGTLVRTMSAVLGPPKKTPQLASGLSPESVKAGGPGFTLQVRGRGFSGYSVIEWNGAARPTEYRGESLLEALIAPSDIGTSGTVLVSVRDPDGRSDPLPFSIAPADAAPDLAFSLRELYAFPNPARRGEALTIRLRLGLADAVRLRIYDGSGRLVHEDEFPGPRALDGGQFAYEYRWDAAGAASGVYTYAITARREGEPEIEGIGKAAILR